MAAVARLRAAGLRLTAQGDTLLVTPRATITDELREYIRGNKATILAELACEMRRRKVERGLIDHPEQRIAVDLVDVPMHPEPGAPVPVMVAVNTAMGIVSGELSIPRERFDPALFLQTLEATARRSQ